MSAVVDWAVRVLETVGAPGVGLMTAVETIFPPVPSEIVLPLAGYTASQGHYRLISAIAWATAGSLVGALTLYRLSARWGRDCVRAAVERIPLLHARDVERAIEWFGRHSRSAVFLGRLVPGVRSFISIPAGLDRMPLVQFSLYTTAGSLVWNTALIGAGYELGVQWHHVEDYVGDVANLLYIALGIGLTYFILRRARRRYRSQSRPRAARHRMRRR